MNVLAISASIACVLAGIFGVSGILHLVATRFLQPLYDSWGLPPEFHHTGGVMELVAAVFLLMPITRIWGIALAAMVLFIVGVSLLKNRHYVLFTTNALLMLALVPASLSALF